MKALLQAGHRVSLGAVVADAGEAEVVRDFAKQLDLTHIERIGPTRAIWNCARAIGRREPMQASYSWSPALARWVGGTIAHGEFDVVHVEHLRGVRYGLLGQSVAALRAANRPAVVWDSVDCISSLFTQAVAHSSSVRSRLICRLECARTKAYEGRLSAAFDRVVVTSEQDRRDLIELATQHPPAGASGDVEDRITVVPNGVDLEYFAPGPGERDPKSIVISGKMSYHANVTAVVQFVRDVMPWVWKSAPDARLWIVGKDPPEAVRQLAGVTVGGQSSNGARGPQINVTGTVSDLRPYLQRATVAVAPIRYGVGIQNKVLEAFACGTPVVATPQAVGNIQASWGQDVLVADEPREFAKAVVSVLKEPDLQARLGRSGRLLVERGYQWRDSARRLTQVYREARSELCQAG